MMKLKILFSVLLVSAASALTVVGSNGTRGDGELQVVKTAVLPDGQIIDWVRRESQDVNFALPPNYDIERRNKLIEQFATPIPAHLRGPEGTVPMVRRGLLPPFPVKKLPPPAFDIDIDAANNSDSGGEPLRRRGTSNGGRKVVVAVVPEGGGPIQYYIEDDYTGEHWYASTSKQTKVTGGGGTVSMYKPYLASPLDFSLMQTAVVRYRAWPRRGKLGFVTQTVEAGWLVHPPRGGDKPFLFTFFSANGYAGLGDYLSGWNAEQRGWVQVDRDIYPGMKFDLYSVAGGDQHEIDLQYRLVEDKNKGEWRWWLRALGRDIGYYPADMFLLASPGDDDATTKKNSLDTLARSGDRIDFYGEVFNSEAVLTATDMGSGEFPDAGDGRVAYFRNLLYRDAAGKEHSYTGYTQETDSSRYKIRSYWNSRSSWGSYVYLGGPGANGVVGG